MLILQATFVDEERAAEFWLTAAGLMERAGDGARVHPPLQLRRWAALHVDRLWRTPADAHAFFSSDEHQAAMRELFHHAGSTATSPALWEMTTPRQRVIFCQHCDGVTPAADGVCAGCGTELFDPFAIPSHAEA